MNKGLLSIFALLLAVVLFFAANILGASVLRGARVDLTQGRLFTLSDGSRNIAARLQEPIRLTMYFSEKAANDVPQFKSYAVRVKELLAEYARASGGKIRLEIVNPEPFSDAEDQAVQAGLAGPSTRPGADRLYFGLVGRNSTDKQQVIPFFDPQREAFLEYDLTRMIYLLSDPPKKTVGLMTWLPMEGLQFNPMGGQGTPPWQILEQMKELFTVKTLETTAREIPDDVGVLMVVHPKGVSTQTRYAIDQFVLRGGRLLLFVDPHCESDVPPGMNPMQAMQVPKASELNTLMAAWGVEMDGSKVAADRKHAVRVNAGSATRPETTPYLVWINLPRDRFNADDPLTGDLNSVILATAGVLTPKEGGPGSLQPLMRTSTDAAKIDTSAVSFFPDPKGLLTKFEPGGQELTLAARIAGKLKSAFPDGPPPPTPSTPEQPIDQLALEAAKAAHLAESKDGVNIVIVTDCDMLADRFWVQEQRLFGQVSLGFSKISDNGDLVIGMLDHLGGSSDLMSLRARSRFARPFERVEEIQRAAEQKYLAQSQELQESLQAAEKRITDLQQQRPDGDNTVLLTPEQEQEIARARLEMVETRKKLRDVQHQLRRDIERLGVAVKAANIAIMPGVVALVAVGLSAYRLSRRKSDRARAGRG